MTQFILKINLGNDAMCKAHHLADALENVAHCMRYSNNYDKIEITGEERKIRDSNGNNVGTFEVVNNV